MTPLLDLRIPVVALDRRLRRIAANTVLVDNERAADEATEHLLRSRHPAGDYLGERDGTDTAAVSG